MHIESRQKPNTPVANPIFAAETPRLTVSASTPDEEAEVLSFLSERVAHTFGLTGFIRSNGIASPHNRGTFYCCRNAAGELDGVALIGHATLFETRSDAATAEFARIAQQCGDLNMLFGEREDVETFWNFYSDNGQQQRLNCRELLFEQRGRIQTLEPINDLRLATTEDLDLIVPVHARTVFEESGINPLDFDPQGFRARCARRIEQNKTWVWIQKDKLIFKAEIVTDSRDVVYLEGVDVNPDERGKGYGLRCLTQLTKTLLERTNSVVLLVNEQKRAAQYFYQKAGFELIGRYDTIFLKQDVQ
ncbi:MAG: GNAT family N-acetyltransferase [Blastocatellia bacterium]